MIGVKTNVVTSVEVTPGHQNDYPQLRPLLASTLANRFNVAKLSADKAYSGHSNLEAIDGAGAFPLIPFRSNSVRVGAHKQTVASKALWRRTHDFFIHNREEFLRYYHKRSNVETTFHMIKSKFGTRIRSKTAVAQVNEVWTFPGLVDTQLSLSKMGEGVFNVNKVDQTEAAGVQSRVQDRGGASEQRGNAIGRSGCRGSRNNCEPDLPMAA